MDDSLKISIITAVFNVEETLRYTLDSISCQTYKNYEVVIIDGGSSDSTIDVAESYREKIHNLTILSEKDKGVYDAMNKGIGLAKGEFVYFLNAGDLLFNNMVLHNVSNSLKGDCVVYGNAYTYNENNNLIPYRVGVFSKYRLAITNICHQTIFYPCSILKHQLFDLRYSIFADYDLNMKLWKQIDFKYIDVDIVKYEGGGLSATKRDIAFEKVYKRKIIVNLGIDAFIYLINSKLLKK